MKQSERELYKAGLELVKIASTARTLVRRPFKASKAVTIPLAVGKEIEKWLKAHPEHVVYGSLPMRGQMFKYRETRDIDLAVRNPRQAALEIKAIFQRHSKLPVRIISSPGKRRYAVQVKLKGEWVDAVDIHQIGMFYGDYDVYGSTLPPYDEEGIKIQKLADQLLRKANSVMAYDPKEKRFGPKPERAVKDIVDFVNTAKMLIASKRVRAKATLARIKRAEKALKVWERYAKKLEGYGSKYKVYKKQVTEEKEKKFIDYALRHPDIPVKNLVFRNGKIKRIPEQQVTIQSYQGREIENPYYANKEGMDVLKRLWDRAAEFWGLK